MRGCLNSLIFAVALTASSAGQAALITYDFTGTLTSSFGSLNSGDAFSGSYTVDTSIAANAGGDASTAVFDNLTSVTLTIGSFTATIGPGSGLPEIQQENNYDAPPPEDIYALVGRNPVGSSQIGGLDLTFIDFRLNDTTEAAISDASVLLTNVTLSSFTSNSFFLFFGDSENPLQEPVDGTLTSLAQRTVPEPATLALLGLGVAGIGFQRGRRLTA